MEPAAPKQRLATKQSKPATGERLAADQRMAAREQPERSERIRPELEHQWLQRTVGYWMDAQPALEQQSKSATGKRLAAEQRIRPELNRQRL